MASISCGVGDDKDTKRDAPRQLPSRQTFLEYLACPQKRQITNQSKTNISRFCNRNEWVKKTLLITHHAK